MMGRLSHDQGEFFYSFRLDEAVPDDHPVRAIAAVLDRSWVHAELAPFYPKIGRPSIDPVLMIRMLIVGYAFAIRSERALCREMRVNLAYRWFCGLSIEDKIPDHSAFSRIRHERFRESDMFRRVFERVVEACIAAGLVGGEGFAVDASLIVADANKQRSIPGTEWKKTCLAETASRATREYLATLDDAAFGAASDVTPKFVSPSDPAAQWTGAMRGPAFFGFTALVAIGGVPDMTRNASLIMAFAALGSILGRLTLIRALRRCLSRPLEREKILRLCNAAQRIAADGDQPVLLRAKRREEGGRGEDRLMDQPAHPSDAADLVHSRADDGEIKAFAAAEIPVHDFPQVEAEIEVGCRQPARVAPLLEFLNLPECLMRCCKRCTASRGSIFAGKHCQRAVADQFQNVAALAMNGRDHRLGIIVEERNDLVRLHSIANAGVATQVAEPKNCLDGR